MRLGSYSVQIRKASVGYSSHQTEHCIQRISPSCTERLLHRREQCVERTVWLAYRSSCARASARQPIEPGRIVAYLKDGVELHMRPHRGGSML